MVVPKCVFRAVALCFFRAGMSSRPQGSAGSAHGDAAAQQMLSSVQQLIGMVQAQSVRLTHMRQNQDRLEERLAAKEKKGEKAEVRPTLDPWSQTCTKDGGLGGAIEHGKGGSSLGIGVY